MDKTTKQLRRDKNKMGKLVIIEYEYKESHSLFDKVDIEEKLKETIQFEFTKCGLNAQIRIFEI